jgi:hypothetical protein
LKNRVGTRQKPGRNFCVIGISWDPELDLARIRKKNNEISDLKPNTLDRCCKRSPKNDAPETASADAPEAVSMMRLAYLG